MEVDPKPLVTRCKPDTVWFGLLAAFVSLFDNSGPTSSNLIGGVRRNEK